GPVTGLPQPDAASSRATAAPASEEKERNEATPPADRPCIKTLLRKRIGGCAIFAPAGQDFHTPSGEDAENDVAATRSGRPWLDAQPPPPRRSPRHRKERLARL